MYIIICYLSIFRTQNFWAPDWKYYIGYLISLVNVSFKTDIPPITGKTALPASVDEATKQTLKNSLLGMLGKFKMTNCIFPAACVWHRWWDGLLSHKDMQLPCTDHSAKFLISLFPNLNHGTAFTYFEHLQNVYKPVHGAKNQSL